MKIEALPDDFIDTLLVESEPKSNHPIPEQYGPLRQFETVGRCASRGCSSPTFFKVQGIHYCMIHALRKLNEMLVALGVDK